MFLHRFKHRGLSLCGGAVDFVSQNNVGEQRAFDKFKFPFSGCRVLENVGAGDVHRHQVRSELNARKIKRHGFSQTADQKCLG